MNLNISQNWLNKYTKITSLIILVIGILVLTGCQSKNSQQNLNQLLESTSSQQTSIASTSSEIVDTTSTIKVQHVDTYGDSKLFGSKDLGFEIKFSEPFQKVDCNDCISGLYLLFGSIKNSLTGEKTPTSILSFSEAKSVNNEFDIVKANITMPESIVKKKVGNFQVMTWKDAGECENRLMEIFGKKYNIILSSSCSGTTEKDDFKYFEDLVKNIKQL
ncbi:MAG: hypothetical protein WCV92_04390 [Candidatus Buchananbacteria bacterium]